MGSPSVTRWNDLSASGLNFAVGSVSPAPQTGGTINGVAGIVYATNTVNSRCNSDPSVNVFASYSLFAVVKPLLLESYRGVYDNDFNNSFFLGMNSTAANFIIGQAGTVGTVQGGTPAIGTAVLLTATFQSAGASGTATLQVNGTTVATGTLPTPTGSDGPVCFGGRTSSSMDPVAAVAGTYGDGAVYTDCKTGSDRLNLNRYFGKKYGITVP